ncbi:MAG: hypothetical protein PCFJNLEI_00457 [Verrucomicrobiae bacterium]|nr:hypothetical protein [Verrucomicrobiae bacterium]
MLKPVIIMLVLALPVRAATDSQQVEAAVDAGVRWLVKNQVTTGPDAGSWEGTQYQTTVASLAGLALLANGHLPGLGEAGKTVERAMKYVQASMTPEGFVGTRGNSMYVHAICTLFGLAYLGMSPVAEQEQELAAWCRKSVALIVASQKVRKSDVERGGWRYVPTSPDSDVSVTTWQLQVLHAARQCGFEIEDEVFASALNYLNSAYVEKADGVAGFVYRPGVSQSPEPGVTGAAVFIKSLLEREADAKMRKSYEYLQRFSPAWGGEQYKGYFYFVTFYLAQGVFQWGDKEWAEFRPALQRLLVEHQLGDGTWEFPPDNRLQQDSIGPAYSTAFAVLLLVLEKQYLPMYQRQMGIFR